MLNTNELNRVVKLALTEDIRLVLVLDRRGVVLSSASGEADNSNEHNAKMITTTSNLWRAYSTNDLTVNKLTMKPEEDALECIFLEFEDSKLCTMSATEYAVVCLVSKDGAMEMGMLKLRTAALQRQVNALLQPIVTE